VLLFRCKWQVDYEREKCVCGVGPDADLRAGHLRGQLEVPKEEAVLGSCHGAGKGEGRGRIAGEGEDGLDVGVRSQSTVGVDGG
jgi:hypothetical protein